jgi:hypothetical protein
MRWKRFCVATGKESRKGKGGGAPEEWKLACRTKKMVILAPNPPAIDGGAELGMGIVREMHLASANTSILGTESRSDRAWAIFARSVPAPSAAAAAVSAASADSGPSGARGGSRARVAAGPTPAASSGAPTVELPDKAGPHTSGKRQKAIRPSAAAAAASGRARLSCEEGFAAPDAVGKRRMQHHDRAFRENVGVGRGETGLSAASLRLWS